LLERQLIGIASFKSLMNSYYSKIMKMNEIINRGNINGEIKNEAI
jgi:hypothetical protein